MLFRQLVAMTSIKSLYSNNHVKSGQAMKPKPNLGLAAHERSKTRKKAT